MHSLCYLFATRKLSVANVLLITESLLFLKCEFQDKNVEHPYILVNMGVKIWTLIDRSVY